MKRSNPPCPCGAAATYSGCCRPYHRGEEPPTAEALMRSRFSAYALAEVEYLQKTLAPAHPDRLLSVERARADLLRFCRQTRFARLRVLAHQEAQVLFHAELYQQGRECSFAELSRFAAVDGGWRYLDGENLPLRANDPRLEGLTPETFLALVRSSQAQRES